MADSIREALRLYVLQDWKKRIDVAIAWLNEEWYNDLIQQRDYEERQASQMDHYAPDQAQDDIPEPAKHYEKWLLKTMDGFIYNLDAKDKVLIRFVSEVQGLPSGVFERVKRLAEDPERVQLAVTALQYLVMFRPPVRETAIDALEDLWRNCKFSIGSL